jgi:seryl-tRNA synthetase
MHDISLIRKNPDIFVNGWDKRGVKVEINKILDLDNALRATITKLQDFQEERNKISKLVGDANNNNENLSKKYSSEVKNIKLKIKKLEDKKLSLTTKIQDELIVLPNIPLKDVPVGSDEGSNIEMNKYGKILKDNKIPPHFEIGERLNHLDFETASKLSGSRFVISKNNIARMERALSNFMIDFHVKENGYEEVSVPILVKEDAMFGTGQLPKFEEDQYKTTDGMWLIPTAEVPLTNLVREKVLNQSDLPQRYVAYTQCFRREAGAAGKDTRGLIRLHQFPKVELVSIVNPSKSDIELERMLDSAQKILQQLRLPYRTILLSTGDMGFSASKTYDLEVWFPSQNTYREISSCSNCQDFQARRMNAKYKDKIEKKNLFVHTLNGSGVAVGRALASILENFYNKDGSVTVPEVLRPYMDGIKVLKNFESK